MFTIIPVCNDLTLKSAIQDAFQAGDQQNTFLCINCGNSLNIPDFLEQLRRQRHPDQLEGTSFNDDDTLIIVMDSHRPVMFENLDPNYRDIVIVDDGSAQEELDLVLAPTPEGTKTEAELQQEIEQEEEEERLEQEREQLGTNDFEEVGETQLTEAEKEERERKRKERRERRRNRQKSQEQIMKEREVSFFYSFYHFSSLSPTIHRMSTIAGHTEVCPPHTNSLN